MKTALRQRDTQRAPDPRGVVRAELDAVEAGQADLPRMLAAVEAKRAAFVEARDRMATELAGMEAEYRAQVDTLARRRLRAENDLRASCAPLVAERGPVVARLLAELDHVREHLGGVGLKDDLELVATAKRRGVDKAHEGFVEESRRRVALSQHAEEIVAALKDVLEEVRDLQLSNDPNLTGAVREVLAALPSRCACGRAFDFTPALADQ